MAGGRRRAEWLLLFGSLLFLLLLGGMLELAVRLFSDVDLLGNSRNLFVANAYRTSNGNAPNVEGSSFGQVVYTDGFGFRVPKGGVAGDAGKAEAILILGDSVGFGPAVEEPETFAGLLRARFPDKRIYNSSVIGYATRDYRNVVESFVPEHPEVKSVVLVFCLNDISESSSRNIDRYLKADEQKAEPRRPPEQNLTEMLRSFTFLSDANDFLRSRSKLYLFLRHRLLKTQLRDWKSALRLYSDERTADVEHAARDIAAIAAQLEQRRIPLAVVLSPFEYQLRSPDDPDAQVPQQKLGELLRELGVGYIDPRPAFLAEGLRSTDYFLAYDSMHFSARGHRVIADRIVEFLERGSG